MSSREYFKAMQLYLINPCNPLVAMVKVKESRWNRYRVWKPLSLMVLAGLTPREWDVSIFDENLGAPDYSALPRPDLVGITAFTSQASRAYAVAAQFRQRGVPVVMGGIHATMCVDEVMERGKKFNLVKGRDFRASVRRIQRHGILVVGSFIIGLDVDTPGIGRRIARTASSYGVDHLNTLFLTPLPGTRLWDQMESENRITRDAFPEDWKYYTLTFPVAQYKHPSPSGSIEEMITCDREFYSMPRILRRVSRSMLHWRRMLISLVGNLSYRRHSVLEGEVLATFQRGQIDQRIRMALA